LRDGEARFGEMRLGEARLGEGLPRNRPEDEAAVSSDRTVLFADRHLISADDPPLQKRR